MLKNAPVTGHQELVVVHFLMLTYDKYGLTAPH